MLLTQRRSHVQDADKFPAVQLLLLALVRVAEPIALTSIFPYAWKLVLSFKFGDESNAGFNAGLLIAAFAMAEAISGMYWGGLSDKIGRKPVLIMGCFGTIASLLIVGFSSNFWVALAGRFLGGALNGNIGVIQTMVSELVVNPAHEPIAYAIMPFVWTCGTIIGPCIGGFFAEPALNFPHFFDKSSIFARFPYLLPNAICAGLMLVSIISGWLLLQETHPDMRQQPDTTDVEAFQQEAQESSLTSLVETEGIVYGTFTTNQHEDIEASKADEKATHAFTKQVIMLTIALGIFTYHSMTFDHLLPIFLQHERSVGIMDIDHISSLSGGLGLTTQQTGIIMSVNGIIALFIQAVVFPVMATWLGIWRTFVLVTVCHPLAYFVMPFLSLLPLDTTYIGIYAALTLRNLLSILAYPLLLILIKEAAPNPASLGKINGLAASTGAACRTIASPVAGYLYGVGMNIGFTPVAWWASALIAILGALQLLLMRRERLDEHNDFDDSLHIPVDHQRHNKNLSHVHVAELDSGYNSADERTPLNSGRH